MDIICKEFVHCILRVAIQNFFKRMHSFAVLWSPARKALTSWLMLVMFIVFFVTFPCGILDQVWYLIVSFSDRCHLSYFLSFRDLFYLNKQCSPR